MDDWVEGANESVAIIAQVDHNIDEMFDQSDRLLVTLQRFGLSPEEAGIFLYLSKNGTATALQISRELHLARTKVYRLLDKLGTTGLVVDAVGTRGYAFKAVEPEFLRELIVKKQSEVGELNNLFPYVVDSITALSGGTKDTTLVKYFKGREGLEQMTWNSLKAKGKLRIYEMVANMSEFLDQTFSELVREEIVKRRIHVQQITNLPKIEAFTKVTEKVEKYWEPRYVDPGVLRLTYEVLVYNDTVAMYNVRGNSVFGVEVQDQYLATMQKQLFDFVWRQGVKMVKIGSNGEARLPS